MIRQIITPLEPSFTLHLPNEMLGKTVEIIAFEVNEQNSKSIEVDVNAKMLRLQRIEDLTKAYLVDLSNFKFTREQATN